MSQQNERVLGQIAEAISRRDLRTLQAHSANDIEYTARFTAMEGKTYRGKEGWAAYLADLASAWQEFRLEIEQIDTVETDVLMASLRVTALARESGAPIDERAFAVFEFRDGKTVFGSTYPYQLESLRAAGLGK